MSGGRVGVFSNGGTTTFCKFKFFHFLVHREYRGHIMIITFVLLHKNFIMIVRVMIRVVLTNQVYGVLLDKAEISSEHLVRIRTGANTLEYLVKCFVNY